MKISVHVADSYDKTITAEQIFKRIKWVLEPEMRVSVVELHGGRGEIIRLPEGVSIPAPAAGTVE